ncbi:MAG TPA: phosphotriesterase-related protein [Ktedonobacteraceae bacterium]|jgi:phosphotriesterase-related protein|nr:phosphotriesterase-related protein [Ktedonobacteraceae bacterium]
MVAVMTVTGPIEPSQLGITYAHEHLLGSPPAWSADREDQDLILQSVEAATKELEIFKFAGGQAIVEMSPADYNRSPDGLRALSTATGVHIIMTTGLHKDAYSRPLTANATVDTLATRFIKDVTEGTGEMGVKAGVVKAATSLNTITPGEEKVLLAAARTHLATGVPISTHTQNGTMGLEQLAIFKQQGVDLSRVALGHVDRKVEYDYHKALLDTGAYLIYDQISKEKYVPDRDRIRLLMRLVAEGHGDRIMLSGDFARVSYWTTNGGGPGLSYILWRFVPWLIAEGMPREAIQAMLVSNPAQFFGF